MCPSRLKDSWHFGYKKNRSTEAQLGEPSLVLPAASPFRKPYRQGVQYPWRITAQLQRR